MNEDLITFISNCAYKRVPIDNTYIIHLVNEAKKDGIDTIDSMEALEHFQRKFNTTLVFDKNNKFITALNSIITNEKETYSAELCRNQENSSECESSGSEEEQPFEEG